VAAEEISADLNCVLLGVEYGILILKLLSVIRCVSR